MKKIRTLFLGFALCVSINQAQAKDFDAFTLYGDIFQFLPVMAGIVSMAKQDWRGLGELAIGTGSVLAATYAIKYSFVGVSRNHPNWATISQRPNNGSYDGFPSGHTASAFSAAGFMQRRYGWKWGVPTTILATLVGVSRVTAQRHTITQVIAGAILGYGVSYLVSSRLPDTVSVNINVDNEEVTKGVYQNIYALQVGYRF